MISHYSYLFIDAGILFLPLIFAFYRSSAFHKSQRFVIPGVLITAVVFISWDILFTSRGVWWFNERYTLPYRLLKLPVEEWLFLIAAPYFCSFIASSFEVRFQSSMANGSGWAATLQLGILLILFGAANYNRLYTITSFAGAGLSLIAAWFLRGKIPTFSLGHFLITFGICLIPMLLMDGLRTGLPIIFYNDAETIGIRIYSVPAENIFMAMLLVLAPMWGMQFFKRKTRTAVAKNYSGHDTQKSTD